MEDSSSTNQPNNSELTNFSDEVDPKTDDDSKKESASSMKKFIEDCDLLEPFAWRKDNPALASIPDDFTSLTITHAVSPKRDSTLEKEDLWLSGGPAGSRNSILIFRSSALANASDNVVRSKPGYQLHTSYKVSQAETKLLSKLLECHGMVEAGNNSTDFNLLWTGSHPKPGTLRSLAPHQRVNHFPRSYELTRKDRLYKNIERMQHGKGLRNFDFIPQTFVMPGEYRELCSTHYRLKGPWIVKPVASSRGRGIFIVENPNQVPLDEPVVVAKYISKPLLVEGHKCDLRLYVLVSSFDPLIVYIYEEGLVRLATVRYDASHKQLWNPCMHLCNYSINKYHSDYVKSDDPSAENVGHKWTLSALLRHLKAQGKDTALLMAQIEDVVVKAILATASSIVPACQMFVPHTNNCFELYGFDILIDEDFKPWLLEVNLSPSLGCDSPLDVRLKSAMLADLLTLVGIPAVDPLLHSSTISVNSSSSSTKGSHFNVLKMKLSNCRRVHSADALHQTSTKKSSTTTQGRFSSSKFDLTAEEMKIVRTAKQQFERRGGFVRIFPTVDSWSKYSQYLETVTGIPSNGAPSSTYNVLGTHNYNQMLFLQLYPDVPLGHSLKNLDKSINERKSVGIERKRDLSLDGTVTDKGVPHNRQERYERMLSQGHRQTFGVKKIPLHESHSAELKRQLLESMKGGKRLTQIEARKVFSSYLACILKRIAAAPDQEGHVEIVLKFLQKASNYLRTPFSVKVPSQKLLGKDRAAIIAKQLNDFLYIYNRETEMYGDVLHRPSELPSNLFIEFLENARECDLEEVLVEQSLHPTSTNNKGTGFQNVLKCLPSASQTYLKTTSRRPAPRNACKISSRIS
ncbi:hypothetical protein PPYR_00303 [Photinus pyralis]|uniref:Tubulin--tyrosine ligase-like protein 5 n=1 Tax=Photinus pyralis TaxID=7054 RepID=A0A1Y1M570_PHOPY|nr:tubulin polyglutamylase TTLL5 isoform X1 [Photinus pyralis]KAB0803333.1 hypothetical protein PPYR_00303 [Photinus pyralis]